MHDPFCTPRLSSLWPGLAVTAVLAVASGLLADVSFIQHSKVSGLTIAILGGIAAAHTVFPWIASPAGPGVDFAKGRLLRLGIVLYGFRISFQQIASVGLRGVLIDVLMVALTFGTAMLIGVRLLKLDRHTAMLIGAGSAICGAAAVLATQPVVRCEAHKVAIAVATVVIFGTLGMFLYPLLFPYLGFTQQQFGLYAGSTLHEVAQVVAASASVGETASKTAVIEKMLRVMMLAPFLLVLSVTTGRRDEANAQRRRIVIPCFAVMFIAASALSSVVSIPSDISAIINRVDLFLLTMAMGALGLCTHVSALRQAGPKPLLLAGLLFVVLVAGGYAVNFALLSLVW